MSQAREVAGYSEPGQSLGDLAGELAIMVNDVNAGDLQTSFDERSSNQGLTPWTS